MGDTKKTASFRMEPDNLTRIRRVAARAHLPVTVMMRAWLLDRLDIEQEILT